MQAAGQDAGTGRYQASKHGTRQDGARRDEEETQPAGTPALKPKRTRAPRKETEGARLAREKGYKPAPRGYHWAAVELENGENIPEIRRNPRKKGQLPKLRWNAAINDFEPISERWAGYGYSDLGTKEPCFPPGTLVKTPGGDRAIEELVAGNRVLSFDVEAGAVITSTVDVVHRNWTRRLAALVIGNELVRATRMHRFRADGTWLAARALWPGTRLHALDATAPAVDRIEVDDVVSETYNLEIARTHTYFVGARGVLVHNGGPNGDDSIFADLTKRQESIYRVEETTIVNGAKVTTVIYVGQTEQTLEERLRDHLAKRPEWRALSDEDRLRIVPVEEGFWTKYETAVWEKHFIVKYKAINPSLENVSNPIGKEKFEKFHDLHMPCP